jgi:tetratricopeptide (TPR) repeat protein
MRVSCASNLALLIARVASAGDLAAAREHYQRGTTLYDLQRFAEAAREYEIAFEMKDEPALLFNIAQAYRFAGDNGKALGAFKAYLRRLPNAPNRAAVEARIADLQRLVEEQKKSQEAPPAETTQAGQKAIEPQAPPVVAPSPQPASVTVEKRGRTKRIAGLAIGGVGIAGLILGATFVGLASSANHDLSHPAANTRFDPALEDRMKLDQSLGAAWFAIGGAAVVTGTVLYVLGRREDRPPRVSFSPSLSADRLAGVLRLQF